MPEIADGQSSRPHQFIQFLFCHCRNPPCPMYKNQAAWYLICCKSFPHLLLLFFYRFSIRTYPHNIPLSTPANAADDCSRYTVKIDIIQRYTIFDLTFLNPPLITPAFKYIHIIIEKSQQHNNRIHASRVFYCHEYKAG